MNKIETTAGLSPVLSAAGFGGWWMLVWSSYRGSPRGCGGAITHAMNNDGEIACGRKLLSPDSGVATDDQESVMPGCKNCRKRVERDRAALTPNEKVGGAGVSASA